VSRSLRPWRPAAEQECLARLWRRAWSCANPHVEQLAPEEHWLARVQTEFVPPCEVTVIEVDGAIGAFMVVDTVHALVEQLFTEPALQGLGLGSALLDEACRRLPGGWMLHVATTNGRAQRFYERYGLARGRIGHNPVTGRERVAYHWPPRVAKG